MKKWNLSLTYLPKILGVCDGSIRQTIRIGRRFQVGDLISFHGWEGVPYRSKWSFRTPYIPLVAVIPIQIYPGGIEMDDKYLPWASLDDLARLDGIDPPTGETLRDVLVTTCKIREGGIDAQVLRWSGFPGRVPEREQNPYKYHTTDHQAHTNRV